MLLPNPAQMRELDRLAIEDFAIPALILMENAGRAVTETLIRSWGPVAGRSIALCCGPGNNGGDGLVVARHLFQLGARPLVLLLADPVRLPPDAAINLEIVRRLGLPLHIIHDERDLENAQALLLAEHGRRPLLALVDALFGTGFCRELQGLPLKAVGLLNTLARQLPCPVLAVDIPSGLDAADGRILGDCINADLTVTLGWAKPGLVLHGGIHTGRLEVADIGIPKSALTTLDVKAELLTEPSMACLCPIRPDDCHKGKNGHLLLLAGSRGKSGAAILAALGALHGGVGLVSIAAPADLLPIYASALPEAMTIPLASSHSLQEDDWSRIRDLLPLMHSVVLGPGLGTAAATASLVLRAWREVALPMVVDADALNVLAGQEEIDWHLPAPRLLTPHPGEMARLLHTSSATVQADRLGAAHWLQESEQANSAPVHTILKGAGTVICNTAGRVAINSSGNAGMATGGMGDVLAGLLGALLAQGLSPWDASRLGVYLHGRAADLLAADRDRGYLASEVAQALPRALASLQNVMQHTRNPALTTPA